MEAKTKLIFFLVGLGVWLLMSLIAFLSMGADKRRAKKNQRRIRERTLFLWSILFGAVGGTLGMLTFRHKTKHWYFVLFFPLLALIQTALAVWGMVALLLK